MIIRPGRPVVLPGMGVQIGSGRGSAAASNWWDVAGQTCVAAYQPKGSADLASSYINLANPGTYNAAPGVAPTHGSVDGWTFNGTSQYLTTGINNANIPNWSLIARYSNATVGASSTIVGTYDTGKTFLIQLNTSNVITFNGAGVACTNTPQLFGGIYAIAGKNPYRNGTAESNAIAAGGSASALSIFIGALNLFGAPAQYTNCKVQALAIYSTTLSGADVAALTTAMNLL